MRDGCCPETSAGNSTSLQTHRAQANHFADQAYNFCCCCRHLSLGSFKLVDVKMKMAAGKGQGRMSDRWMVRILRSAIIPGFCALAVGSPLSRAAPAPSDVNILTNHNDNHNNGENLHEMRLTPRNVRVGRFGKLFATRLDGVDYGQPLFISHVDITVGPHRGVQNIIIAATSRDRVYAINADSGRILWTRSLLTRFDSALDKVKAQERNPNWAARNEPLEDTPVIDPATGALYVECEETEQGPGTHGRLHWIHLLSSLRLSNGSPYARPIKISESGPRGGYISGPTVRKADGKLDRFYGFEITFRYLAIDPVNHVLYMACADPGDIGPYNGWILGYDTAKNAEDQLPVEAVWSATPSGWAGGIWGGPIAIDRRGNLFVETGNGTFETRLIPAPYRKRLKVDSPNLRIPALGDFGDAALKLVPDSDRRQHRDNPNGFGLHVAHYFVPRDENRLLQRDLDLGSSSPVLLPASAGDARHPHLLVINDKQGIIYLLDRDHMGGYHGGVKGDGRTGFDEVVQKLSHATGPGFSTGAFFAGPHRHGGWIYYAEVNDFAKAFFISHAHMNPRPQSESPYRYGYPGSTPEISADGRRHGIVWLLNRLGNRLIACRADNLGHVLFDSNRGTGRHGLTNKLIGREIDMDSTPTVADGRVYVSTTDALNCYGLLHR